MDKYNIDEVQEAIDLAVGYILEQATYYRPSDLPEINLDDYFVIVMNDDISIIQRGEGLQLGNTESLKQWLQLVRHQ